MNDDFVPSEILKRSIKWWWLLAILMICGGLIGMLVTRLHKPVYESKATITISIDYAYAGRLTDVEEDQLISTIGDVIDSTAVINQVISGAAEKNITLSTDDIKSWFAKARQGYRWELSVRDIKPVNAQTLNQLWVDSSMEELSRLRERSLDSLHYHTAQLALEKCFSQTVVLDPVSAACSLDQISKIQKVFEQIGGDANSMSLPDSILLSKVSVQVTNEADLPANPVLFKQNINMFIGVVFGLILSLGIMALWNPIAK
ncbi:MAG: hypothetical protein FD147_1271 [Chloroflexi bacterium]|nr:MAG: hypothetical protein FD147_1271 [Chloroflexota bacterium]MBA4375513.1 hypothetical protein [Anaerolinea sp.]